MISAPSELPRELADALADAGARLGPLGRRVEYFPTIGSTNDVASRRAATGDGEGVVFVADAQTAGRGRRGRTWFSPPGAGLYLSTIIAPGRSRDGERATLLTTLAAGVALVEGVRQATGLAPSLKWPNDLYVGRRKLAGILAEGAGDAVVLGYGINIGNAAFPPELADRVTSLESELGRAVDRAAVFVETLCALARRYDDLLEGRFDAILDAWRALAPAAVGSRVSWTTPSGERRGVTAGIDDRGALLVRSGEQVERIVAGEVLWEP
ncbi:MAG TPA: biotin--[acetyl-CoA-carboxylase] ligase [Vicinamibacterales bacterium]|nr:biotin--[acetyl-CoA-carboxylase] ligase [Vicinamibacterales bacterium]